MPQTMGVAGEFDAEQFNQGLNKYIKALLNAEKATDKFVTKLNALGTATNALASSSPALQTVARSVDQLYRSLTALGTIKLNQQLPLFVERLATASAKLATAAPGMATASRSLTLFASSMNKLSGIKLSATPFTKFTNELFTAFQKFGRLKSVTTTVENLRSTVNSLVKLSSVKLNAKNIAAFSQQFAPAMQALSRALKGATGIKAIPVGVINSLKGMTAALQGLGAIPKIGPAVTSLGKLIQFLPQLAKIPSLPPTVGNNFANLANNLSKLGTVTNLNPVVSGLRRLIPLFQQLAQLKPIPANVVQSLTRLSTTMQNLGNVQNISHLATVLRNLTQAVNQLANAESRATPQIQRFGNALTQGIGVGVGFGVVQILQKIGQAIGNLGREALNSIRFFEVFQVALESVVAIGIKNEDQTVKMADALQRAQRPARGLSLALEKLAIFSPFTTQEIALAFRTATAYGFTAEQALNLTNILVDFTSGAGLVGDELYRISLALSQVQARGKLAGEEVRQLANAGVPIVGILAKGLDKSSGEILKMIKDGKVLANVAIPLILEHMEQWEGSGKRLASTFTGLLSSLKDIQQVAFRDLFGGALEPVREILQDLVDFLTTDEFRAALVVIGQLIGEHLAVAIAALRASIGGLISSFQSLSPETKQTIFTFAVLATAFVALVAVVGSVSAAVIALVNPFTVLVTVVAGVATAWVRDFGRIQSFTTSALGNISRLFDNLATAAIKWGANIVNALAVGMTRAVSIVTRALSVIGRAIGGLLRPGSPPKLLPHLTKWGEGAAVSWLEGWSQADFGALDSFAGLVQSHLSDLSALGQVKDTRVPSLVIDFRKLFADALTQIKEFGSVSAETLEKLSASSRLSADVLAEYFQKYAALTQATKDAEDAQNELNAVTKQYDEILEPLNRRLAEIQDQQADISDAKQIARLRRILANEGISDSKRLQAQLELEALLIQGQIRDTNLAKDVATDAAQDKLDAAKEAEEAAKEELDFFNNKLKAELAFTSLLAEEQRLRKQIADSSSKALKEGLTALEKQLKVIELQQEELRDLIDAEEQRYILSSDDYTVAQKKTAELKLQEIALRRQLRIAEAEKLGLQVDFTEIEKIPIVLADFLSKDKLKGDDIIDLGDVIPGLDGGLGELEDALGNFDDTLQTVRGQITGFFADFQTALDQLNDKLPPFLRWKQSTEELKLASENLIATGENFGVYGDGALEAAEKGEDGFNRFKEALITFGAILAGGRAITILRGLPLLIGGLLTKTNLIGAAIGLAWTAWNQNWGNIQEKTKTAIDEIDKKIGEWVGGQVWTDLKQTISDLGTALVDIFTGKVIPENALTLIGQKVAAINAKLLEIGQGLITQDTGETIESISLLPSEEDREAEKQSWLDWIGSFFTDTITAIQNFWSEHISDEGLVGWIGDVIAEFIRLMGVQIGLLIDYMIGTALPNVVNAFGWLATRGIPTLTKKLNEWGDKLETFFAAMGVRMREGIELALKETMEFFTLKLPSALSDAGKSIAEGFINGFTEFLEKTGIGETNPVLQQFLDYIKLFWGIESPSTIAHDQFGVPIGEGFINGFIKAIVDLTTNLLNQLETLKTEVITKLGIFSIALVGEDGFFPTLNKNIFGLFDKLKEGVLERVDQMIKDLLDRLTGEQGLLKKIQTDFVEKGEDLGRDFIKGIAKGIDDNVYRIEKAAKAAVKAAEEAARDEMQAQSPAKVPEKELGKPFAQGFAKGILGEINTVLSASERLTDAALRVAQQRLGGSTSNSVAPITNNSHRTYNLNVNSTQPSRGIVRDFRVMEVMAGA